MPQNKYQAAFPPNESGTVTQMKTSTCLHRWIIKDFNTHLAEYKGCMKSSTFCQPDDPRTSWRLLIYPNGICEARGWVSLYLKLASRRARSFRARAEFSLIRDDGTHAAQTTVEAEFRTQQPTCGVPKFLNKEQLLNTATSMLPDDALTIVCKVTVLGEISHTAYATAPVVRSEKDCDFTDDFNRLYRTGQFSDFVISAGNKEFRVHKAVLAARSPVFLAMLVSPSKESQEDRMTIEDLKPDAVEKMLAYMYTGKATGIGSVMNDLLRAADKYQMPLLKTMCAEWMKSELSAKNVADVFLLAATYSVPELMISAGNYISAHAAEVVSTEGWRRLANLRPEVMAGFSSSLVGSKRERYP
ncbi:speckle-type POZ protein B-like [Ornithodoros turicata]|uniref:speckle-type POZ protein B-like n=1 Tax=Ornithodoros turicata TaxID=34597 RepID=UPI00313A1CEC